MISTYEFGKAFFRKHNEEQRGGWDVWTITVELHDHFHPNWPAFRSALACILLLSLQVLSRVQFNSVTLCTRYLLISLSWDGMGCVAVRLQHITTAPKHAGKTAFPTFICMYGWFEGILDSRRPNLGCEMFPGSMWSSYMSYVSHQVWNSMWYE